MFSEPRVNHTQSQASAVAVFDFLWITDGELGPQLVPSDGLSSPPLRPQVRLCLVCLFLTAFVPPDDLG